MDAQPNETNDSRFWRRGAEAELCRILGDPTRLSIVVALAPGPLAVGELCQRLEVPQSTTSRHLKILRDHGLVMATRDAQRVLYSLKDRHLLKVVDTLSRYLAWSEQGGSQRPSWSMS